MARRKVAELEVHPFNLEVYGEPDLGLEDSLKQFGLQYPVDVSPSGEILSGARRWRAAKELGWDDIEVRVVAADDGYAFP